MRAALSETVRPVAGVFLLQHCRADAIHGDDVKVIGVYSSRMEAERAVERIRAQPGFLDHPRIIDALVDEEESGFFIDEYLLDKDHWSEGFGLD